MRMKKVFLIGGISILIILVIVALVLIYINVIKKGSTNENAKTNSTTNADGSTNEKERDIFDDREVINMQFVSFGGEQRGERIKWLFEEIVYYNRVIEEKPINLKYENETITKDEDKIWEYSMQVRTDYNYNVTIEYDQDGFTSLIKVQMGSKRDVTEQDEIYDPNMPVR